jgi:hypothetical protein
MAEQQDALWHGETGGDRGEAHAGGHRLAFHCSYSTLNSALASSSDDAFPCSLWPVIWKSTPQNHRNQSSAINQIDAPDASIAVEHVVILVLPPPSAAGDVGVAEYEARR